MHPKKTYLCTAEIQKKWQSGSSYTIEIYRHYIDALERLSVAFVHKDMELRNENK